MAKENRDRKDIAEERISEAKRNNAVNIDLSDLGLTEPPKSISELAGLQAINLRGNQLAVLPEWMGHLTALQRLQLDSNQLTALPECISNLPGLQRLDLDRNQLTTVPDWIGQLTRLQTLYIQNNQLTAAPQTVGQLTELKELYLNGNRLTALPESMSKLAGLQVLHLDRNQLTALPESISKLAGLQVLHLGGNQLTELPEWIGQLRELKDLNVARNQLIVLPESMSKLTGLNKLDLGYNQLAVPPDWIGRLTGLQVLHLGGTQLTELPEWIGQLSELKNLNLGGNQLVVLPVFLSKLTGLERLNLDRNKLTVFPEWIGQLTRLERLDVDDNRLTALPKSIGQLSRLQTLSLEGNQLTTLPESIVHLSQLKELFLHGNSGLGLPAEVLGPSWIEEFEKAKERTAPSSILEYYFRSRQGQPLYEAKLILVGRGGVGKTSLVSRLVDNTFKARQKKTEGIQITKWNIRLNRREVARLNVWDFGGQEIMHATHQFFLTERSLYLLVLNGREGEEDRDADYWLRLIESFGGNSPVIVVLNKFREHPFDVNRRALQQKYVGIREFIGTDCKDGRGIKELRRAVERETDRLDDLRVKFPASWVAIKDRLAGMKENFLDFDTYRKECTKLGEIEAGAQEKLAGYLHSLGIALNFKDDPRLQDTHVLNPHWVTNGIYKILNARELAEGKGEIVVNDLKRILDKNAYPNRMHGFLLDLMRKFELCFPLSEDSSGRFLITELLDKQEPTAAGEFVPEACLNFEFHYPVLPEGLIPRFIVRTYPMSTGLPRWRTGVIVRFDRNMALVRGDLQGRKVSISVSGPVVGRRNLLAIIRSDLERIHANVAKLQPKAMVPVPEKPSVVIDYNKLIKFEERGIREFQEIVGDDIVSLDVQALLNGVDVAKRGNKELVTGEAVRGVRLFISYAHKDESLRAELDAHLKLFQRNGLIEKWDDRLLNPGEEWKGGIDQNLELADIILFLISADFLNSDFCWKDEMTRALERHDAREARVIPVIIRDAAWQKAKFAKLQVLPKEGKAVTLWPDRDSAWRNVAEGIEKVALEIHR